MAKPLIDLDDDTLFSNPSPGQQRRPGLSVVPDSKPKINLNDDSLFYKNKEEAGQDVLAERLRVMYGGPETPKEAPQGSTFKRIDDTITGVFGTNKPDPSTIDQAGVDRVKAEEAAFRQDVARRRTELGTDEPGFIRRNFELARQFDNAAAGAAGMIGKTAEYIGRQFGIKTLEDIGYKAQVDSAALSPQEANLLDKVMMGVGSFLPMAAAGTTAAVGTMAVGGSAALASTAAAVTGALTEAPSIGQEAYEGARKVTGNEAVAERQGYKAIAYNLPLSYITNKLGFFADTGGRTAQTAKTVLMEGTQEGGQKVLTNVMGYQPTGEGVSEEALVGGLTGGAVKQLTYSPDERAKGKTPTPPPIDPKERPQAVLDRPGGDSAAQVPAEIQTLDFFDMRSTLATKPSIAAVLYQDAANDQERELIRRAVDRAEIQDGFAQALGDGKLLEDTRQEMGEYQEFVQSIKDSIPAFVNDMPPKGVVKLPSRSPSFEAMKKSWDEAWNDESYQQQMDEEGERFAAQNAGETDVDLQQEEVQQTPMEQVQGLTGVSQPWAERVPLSEWSKSEEKYGLTSYYYNTPERAQSDALGALAYSHPALPGMVFPSKGAVFEALKIRKAAIAEGTWNTTKAPAKTAQAPNQTSEAASPKASGLALVQERFSREFNEKPDNFKLTKAPAYFNKLAQALGVEVVAYNYTGTNGQVQTRAGMLLSRDNGKAVVAINLTKANQGALFVFGHEVFHELERRDPEGAASLAREIRGYVSENTQQAYQQFYEAKGEAQKTDSEIAADVMGQMFTDKKFWEQLGQKNPSLVQRVLGVIDSIIERFKTNADSRRMQIGKELEQYEKVRDMVASFVATAAEKPAQQATDAAMDDDLPAKKITAVKKPEAPEASPAQDAKTLEKVTGLLREGKIGPAAKLFKEAKLFDKGFGSFTDLQRMAKDTAPQRKTVTVTTPEGKTIKADERKRYGDGVRMNKDGQMVIVTNPNAAQVAKTDDADEDIDQVGMSFKRVRRPRNEELPDIPEVPAPEPKLDLKKPAKNETDLKTRFDAIIRKASRIKFFDDTILALNNELNKIDRQLKDLRTVRATDDQGNEVVYRSIDRDDENPGLWAYNDENSYDRLSGGFRPDKATSKEFLLDARRRIADDLQFFRDKNSASRARLYKRGVARMFDLMQQEADRAVLAGMSREKAQEIYNEYFAAYSIKVDMRPQQIEESPIPPSPVDPNVDVDGVQAAMNIIGDVRASRTSERDEAELIQRGMRDGDFTFKDVMDAYRGMRLSPPRAILDTTAQLAVRKRLDQHMAENDHSTASRLEWLTSMRKALISNPGLISRFTQDEIAYYQAWIGAMKPLASRRRVNNAMRQSETQGAAFPNLLFNRYTLEEAGSRTELKRMLGEPREAWFQDVAYALRRRPDLSNQIFEKIADDKQEFDAWVDRKKKAVAKEAEMLAKAPGFVALRNIFIPPGSLESVAIEDRQQLDSVPLRDMDTDGRPNVRPSDYERQYTKLANAELEQLPRIMDELSRLNAIATTGIDPETGEIFASPAQAQEFVAQYIDDMENQAQMGEVEYRDAAGRLRTGKPLESDAPASIKRGESGFEAGTLERNAEVIRSGGADRFGDASVDELRDEGVEVTSEDFGQADNMFEMANDEDADVETENEGSDNQDVAAEEKEAAERARVPGSLTGEDYRFKRGPFSAVLVPSIVQERVSQITASWPSAPRIAILPNADHLPKALRDAVKARLGKHMGAKGLYHNGEIYLFSDHLSGLADVEFVLFHEAYGHLGMRAFLGAKFDQFLTQTYNTNPQVRDAVDRLMKSEAIGRLEAIDEVLSDMAAENQQVGAVKAFVGRVIAGLREIGLGKVAGWLSTLTNAELGYTLKMARKAAQEGVPAAMNGAPDVIRLAEQRLPYELFSGPAGKTRAYARYNPVTGSWAIATANGPDLRQGWNTQIETDFEKVMEIMGKYGRVERRMRSGMYIDNKIASDLQKIPEFSISLDDVKSQTTKVGQAKMLGRMIFRNTAMYFQNEYRAAFQTLNYLRSRGRLTEDTDFAFDLEGNHERMTASELEDVRKQYHKPIFELVRQLGTQGGSVTLAQAGLNLPPEVLDRSVGGGRKLGDIPLLDAYLVARHAEERNKHVAGLHKNNPKKQDGGSGMLTNDARAILDELSRKPYRSTLEEISNYMRQLSAYKLARLEGSGMITPEEASKRANYQDYVNLSGINDGLDKFDDPSVYAGTSKFATRKDKRSLGRDTMASDVLARTLMSFEAAVISANKNVVKQKILGMLEFNYDPDFVAINKQAYRPVLDENGQVTEQIDPEYIKRKNVMVVHVRGRPTTIEFKRTGRGTFADAVHGAIFPPEVSAFPLRVAGKINQLVGQMLTTWNPIWSVINFSRDTGGLYFNAVADNRVTKKMARQMVQYLPSAVRASFHHATDGRRANGADPEMLRYFREMRASGGATSFLNLRGLEKTVDDLYKLIDQKDPNQFVKVGTKVLEAVEAFNLPLEMAPRLAAYRVMRENGFSKAEAAAFAGEITVNFNMRGSARWVRQAFLFFNPAAQGLAKMWKLAEQNPKGMMKIAAGMAVVGFMVNILARALGGEEEDGIAKLDGIPVFKRATNILLPNPLGSPPFIAIPIPYGWNAFYAAGHFLADTMYAGSVSAGTTAKRILQTAFESFSPLGSAGLDSQTGLGTLAKGIAPTPLLPIIELALNENRFGAPIVKTTGLYSSGKRPDSEMAFDSASPISSAFAKGMNRLTGGDSVNPGLIDVNPGTIDYLISSYIPGIGAEIYKFSSWATKKALGYDTKDAKTPLDRLTAKRPDGYEFGMYRRAQELIKTKYDDYLINKENREQILKEYPNLGVARGIINSAQAQIDNLREARNLSKRSEMSFKEQVEFDNRSRAMEKKIVQMAVKRVIETNPQMKQALLASE